MKVVLRCLFCLLFGTASGWIDVSSAEAQGKVERPGARGAAKIRKRPKRTRPETAHKVQRRLRPRARALAKKTERTSVPSAVQAAQDAASGADAEIVKEGETTVKVMKFTGLDIEGRLKSPQLVYFVQRVHAEFERPTLPHRSFLPELAETTQREPVR